MDFFQSLLFNIATHKNLTKESHRIFLLMLSSIEAGAFIPLTPTKIKRILKSYPAAVNRGISGLIKEGIISKRYESEKLVGYELLNRK